VDAERGQARWAEGEDPRRTPVGRLLRAARLDELPQLVNILRGHMSFVGPRPERPEFVEHLERAIPYYAWRHLVRPGLTGWAQINHPYGSTVDDAIRKLEYDLYYIRHASLATDLAIVLRTALVARRRARYPRSPRLRSHAPARRSRPLPGHSQSPRPLPPLDAGRPLDHAAAVPQHAHLHHGLQRGLRLSRGELPRVRADGRALLE